MHIKLHNRIDNNVVHKEVICSGFSKYNCNKTFIVELLKIMAHHFSQHTTSITVTMYDHSIIKDDDTGESFERYKYICQTLIESLRERGIHPDALEVSYKEWLFHKARKKKNRDTDPKMAVVLTIHNHRIMNLGYVDKMEIGEDGTLVRSDYPTDQLLIAKCKSLHDSIEEIMVSLVQKESLETDDRRVKILQAMTMMEQASNLLKQATK